MSVSLAMLVRNPPMDRLAVLLDYLAPILTDVVIVDTGTNDRDLEVMKAWPGVTVINHEWKNDFSEARNVALDKCTGEWTLVLDPDELPTPAMLGHIASVTEQEDNPALAYVYWTKNFWDGVLGPEEDYHWHIRLFRTKHGRFYRPIHELVEVNGKPEHISRGTSRVVNAPKGAYLIHSKPGYAIIRDDVLYANIGEVSK